MEEPRSQVPRFDDEPQDLISQNVPVEDGRHFSLANLESVTWEELCSYPYQKRAFEQSINNQSLAVSKAGLQNTSLEYLCIYLNENPAPDVHTLIFSHRQNPLTLNEIEYLINHLPNSITTLKLENCGITDEGAQLLSTRQFKQLDLQGNQIGSEGARRLLSNPYIETLDLSCNQIDPSIADALQNTPKNLKKLVLSSNNIGYDAAIQLSQNKNLKQLYLSNTKISDQAALAFAENNTLSHLDLSENNLSEETCLKLLDNYFIFNLNLETESNSWRGNFAFVEKLKLQRKLNTLHTFIKELEEKQKEMDLNNPQWNHLQTLLDSLNHRTLNAIPGTELDKLISSMLMLKKDLPFDQYRNPTRCDHKNLKVFPWFKPLIGVLLSSSIAELRKKTLELEEGNIQKTNLQSLLALIDARCAKKMTDQEEYELAIMLNSTIRHLNNELSTAGYTQAIQDFSKQANHLAWIKPLVGAFLIVLALTCFIATLALLISLAIGTGGGGLAVIIAPFVALFKEISALIATITISNFALAPLAPGIVLGANTLIMGLSGFFGGLFAKQSIQQHGETAALTNCMEKLLIVKNY